MPRELSEQTERKMKMLKLQELLNIQEEFTKTLTAPIGLRENLFALNIEMAEFLNTLPWKWWKKKYTKTKEEILDEMADILAFFLAYYNIYIREFTCPVKGLTEQEKAQILHSVIFKLELGLQRGIDLKEIDIFELVYFDKFGMGNPEVVGVRIGKLIKLAMIHSKSSLEEVIEAYKRKMEINHERQYKGY